MNMKRLMVFAWLALTVSMVSMAALKESGEYYIWLNIYEKLLGTNENGDGPALSAYGTKDDGYVFVAEASGKDGYVLLRQKSSGLYLAASSKNTWSVTLESKSADDRFCWKADEGTYVYVVNKKSGKYLGIDGAAKGKKYVGVYYDKPKGSHSQFTVIPVVGTTWAEARQAYESGVYKNAQGVSEVDYCQLSGKTLDISDAVDIHITSNDTPLTGGAAVNLGSDRTWLVLDNVVPSEAVSKYLKMVTIGGNKALNNKNCRVAVYLNGSAIIPIPETIMTCTGTEGDFTLAVGNHRDLGEQSNAMTSFTLRRGYMATLATGTAGTGYSRVYVADHQDLTVTLPKALTKRVTSVNVKPWQYLSKKGWADTGGATKGPQLRASWFWSWSAGYNSTADMEYVPCRQHRYWPSAAEVNSKTQTAALSLNEPEHSEQHTSDKCSCGGTIDAWTAYKLNSDFMAGGGRIGSPQPTDFSYLTEYCQHVDNMASRCDFTVTHAYWNQGGRSETGYADWFVGQCMSIYSSTGRPVWITEMEIGSTWGEKFSGSYDDYAKFLQVLLQKMDECDYIERYAIYTKDYYKTQMFYDDGGITPAGQVYRDHRATFAYHANCTKEPNWWVPGVSKPTLNYEMKQDQIVFKIGNANGDATEKLVLERQQRGGEWQPLVTLTKRSDFEKAEITCTVPLADVDTENDSFRVTTTTIYGGSETSGETDASYIKNPRIETTSKEEVPEWTCKRNAANGFTKAASGDTYLEVWDASATDMAFDYYQDLTGLPAGYYELSAVCFNSTNGVSGAVVNGNVGLYAQAEGLEYFAPVTEDSEIDYTRVTVIPEILVTSGSMRIGIKNQGPMTARWAGADNFELKYLGTEKDVHSEGAEAFAAVAAQQRDEQLRTIMPSSEAGIYDASVLIANADCNRSNNYGWTVENLGTNKGQAWDGEAGNVYWDKWNSGSLTSSMTQTIDYLPVGEYELGALLRCTSGETVTLTAHWKGKYGEKTYSGTVTGTGDQSAAGSSYQNGWQLLTLSPIHADSGDQLTITAQISAAKTAWWSADHFTLKLSYEAPNGVQTVQNGSQQPQRVFDLQGRCLGTDISRSSRGIYIVNGRKIVK